MSLDPLLLDVLACPVDKGPLLWFEDEDVLYNPRLKKSYRVEDGVPVMLVDEAVDVSDTEAPAAGGQGREGQGAHDGPGRGVSPSPAWTRRGCGTPRPALPEQMTGALETARRVFGPSGALDVDAAPFRAVVGIGVGTGSAACEAVAALAGPALGVPFVVWRGGAVPPFVGPGCLVLAASCGAESPETLAAVSEAVARGAARGRGRQRRGAGALGVVVGVPLVPGRCRGPGGAHGDRGGDRVDAGRAEPRRPAGRVRAVGDRGGGVVGAAT